MIHGESKVSICEIMGFVRIFNFETFLSVANPFALRRSKKANNLPQVLKRFNFFLSRVVSCCKLS